MADTVVTLGGDSSGLQDAFKDAGKKAEALKTDAKKLTDQLKEVGDEADKAAGAFVEKFGGAGAIKAIAGVGTAVGLAKAGVEAFLDSSEALFKSYGDEGQKVWDDTEKSLFAIKGAFAEAVLGGGSMEEMGARLKGIFDGVKRLLDGLLMPIKLVTAAFYDNADGAEAARKGVNDYNEAVERTKKSSKDMAEQTKSLTEEIWALTGQTDKLNASQNEGRRARIMDAIVSINAEELAQDQRIALSVQEASYQRDRERALKEAVKRHHRLDREGMEEANKLTAQYQQESYDNALATQTKSWNAERKARLDQQAQNLADLNAYIKKQQEEAAKGDKPTRTTRTVAAPAKESGPEDPVAYARVYMEGLMELSAEAAAAISASEAAYGESSTSVITTTRSQLDALLAEQEAGHRAGEAAKKASMDRQQKANEDFWTKEREAEEANAKAKAAFDKAEADKAVALAEETANKEKEARAKMMADLYVLTVNNSAKMLAVDLQDKEKSKTAAQRATAAVISGLGDMAMVKSGLAAAAGNFGEAAAYSVVGTLAYAAAAKLAPSEKSKTTAPAAAVNGPATFNTSYNLRVDAAFADGESVARRFAEMQQGAQRRGLI